MTSVERSPFGIDKEMVCESHPIAVDFEDISNLGHINELIDQPLAVNFGQDAPLIVIPARNNSNENIFKCKDFKLSALPERPTHRLVVHVWFVLVQTPQSRHSLAVHQLEHPLLPVAPLDELGAAVLVLEELEQELPEVGRRSFPGLPLAGHPVWTDFR